MKTGQNLILIGFMGSGKTSLGIRLSYQLQMSVEDTDKIIEKREGCSISSIFQEKGEQAFRQMETQLLKELASYPHAHIYSLGGGTPVQPQNRELIRDCGYVVYLRAKPETIYERLKFDTTRPLLQCEDPQSKIRDLMSQRAEAYEACADLIVDVDNENGQELAALICKKYKAFCLQMRSQKKKQKLEKDRKSMKILVINGPNLNFLGIREKTIYGTQDYAYLVNMIEEKAKREGFEVECYQSNHEGAIIDRIQQAYFDGTDGIVINPGAYTHYSYAIHDALESVQNLIKVEIHISDITAREDFRKISVTAPACHKQIYGQGLNGYLMAIDTILQKKVEK